MKKKKSKRPKTRKTRKTRKASQSVSTKLCYNKKTRCNQRNNMLKMYNNSNQIVNWPRHIRKYIQNNIR